MEEALEKLVKFLKLEASRGYDNKAVMGGLEKFLPVWQQEGSRDNLTSIVMNDVEKLLLTYPALTASERAENVINFMNQLRASYGKTSPQSTGKQAEPTSVSTQPAPIEPKDRKTLPKAVAVGLDAPLTVLSGVGPQNAARLQKLGIATLGDLLHHYPRRYDDYSQLKTISQITVNDEVTIIGVVQNIQTRELKGRKIKITEAIISDNTGYLRISWFNQPWLEKSIKPSSSLVISGKIELYLGKLTLNSPEWEPLDQEQLNTNRIVPVYPLTAKMTQKWLRKIMYKVLSYWSTKVVDYIPPRVIENTSLLPLSEALNNIHFPESAVQLDHARKRLGFDEIFILQMGLLLQKHRWQSQTARVYRVPEEWFSYQIEQIPFTLTNAQARVLQDIREDFSVGHPMNRLIQGDVGSGKTIVAAIAIAMITFHGKQAAIMAPTSILAEQHFSTMTTFLAEGENPHLKKEEIALLIGSTPAKEKKRIKARLANGEIRLLVGTHALLEEEVLFQDLQFVVIDEQHRFGVMQRAILREKGDNPHLLVMTATPIPRSMALTVYGDLDISTMDELPPGRKLIPTSIILPKDRVRIYDFIKNELRSGRQAFIIYPLVEQGDNDNVKAAVDEQIRLQEEIFPDFKIGLMHGRLKPNEKDEVMNSFRFNKFDILVSTSVVEVGVDIPNASIMVIEGANRFGLAQLHQIRGRVGRGAHQSYCFLLPDVDNAAENERLQVMASTNDGFTLAEKDLAQRGPGDFLGTRQSGYSGLKIASLTDSKLIEIARTQAKGLHIEDPELVLPENQPLKNMISQYWSAGEGDQS